MTSKNNSLPDNEPESRPSRERRDDRANRITRTFTYPAFMSAEDQHRAIEYMDQVRSIFERAALEPTIEAARAVVRTDAAEFWWPNRSHLETLLWTMLVKKERFKPGLPIVPLQTDSSRGTLAGSVLGTVRRQGADRAPMDALFTARTLKVEREPVGDWHGYPLYRMHYPVTTGSKDQREYLDLDFPLTRPLPDKANLYKIVLTGSNLRVPVPNDGDHWPVLVGDKTYIPPAARFKVGFVLSYDVARDKSLPRHTGFLRPKVHKDKDGTIHIAQLHVQETNEKLELKLPSDYLQKAHQISRNPFANRNRQRFLRWKWNLYHHLALDVFRRCSQLVIENDPSSPKLYETIGEAEYGSTRRMNVHFDDVLDELVRTSASMGGTITRRHGRRWK